MFYTETTKLIKKLGDLYKSDESFTITHSDGQAEHVDRIYLKISSRFAKYEWKIFNINFTYAIDIIEDQPTIIRTPLTGKEENRKKIQNYFLLMAALKKSIRIDELKALCRNPKSVDEADWSKIDIDTIDGIAFVYSLLPKANNDTFISSLGRVVSNLEKGQHAMRQIMGVDAF